MIQADLGGMDGMSSRLTQCGVEVRDLKRALTSVINSTTWTGGAADRFRHAWDTEFQPALDRMVDELEHAAQHVTGKKVEIDNATR